MHCYRNEVPLLFISLVMLNGLGGLGLADKLQSERPDLKVLYASGYSAEAVGADWLQTPGAEFLPKPFTAAGIIKAVSTVFSWRTPDLCP